MTISPPSTRTRRTGHFMSAISDQKFCTNTRNGTIQTQSIRCKSDSTMATLFLTTTTILSSTSRICQRPSRRRLKVAFKRPSLYKIPGSTSTASGCVCPGSDIAVDSQHHQHETVKVPMAGRLFFVDSPYGEPRF